MIDPYDDTYFMKKALQEAQDAYDKGEIPVGAIIVFQPFFASRFKIPNYLKNPIKKNFNWKVLLAWLISISIFYGISMQMDIFLSFLTLPTWICCGLIYLILSKSSLNRQ